VVDGACRDVAGAQELAFPVYARASVPATARSRLRQRSTGETVVIAGVTVEPGDVVVADATGVVFVPACVPSRCSYWPPRSTSANAPSPRICAPEYR
jgi:regulator of RNase E activity RraA